MSRNLISFEAISFGDRPVVVRPGRRGLVSRAGGVSVDVPVRVVLHADGKRLASKAHAWLKKIRRWGYDACIIERIGA